MPYLDGHLCPYISSLETRHVDLETCKDHVISLSLRRYSKHLIGALMESDAISCWTQTRVGRVVSQQHGEERQ
jgi:hypothetical protein